MNIKLRSALLFTALVAILLSVSYLVIYFIYADYRNEQVFQRLEQKAQTTYKLLVDVKEVDADLLKVIDQNTINMLNDEKILIFDSTYKLIYSSIDDQKISYSPELLKKIHKEKILRYVDGDNEVVGIEIYEHQNRGIVLASAYDKIGINKLQKLYYILLFSFIVALIVTAIISYFYVKKVFHPLDTLNSQIVRIGEGHMDERVPLVENQDELNELASNFNAMLDKLEEAFRIQKSFISHASHELRTPLANLVASCESALNKTLSNEEYKQLIVSLNEEHKNLVSLTNALLLLSKYENFSGERNWNETRIDESLFQAMDENQELFPAVQISLNFDIQPDNEENLYIKGHEVLLRTLFSNLLRNSCQYSTDAHVTIHVDCDDKFISVTIENKGPVISDEEIPMLFNPFFRGNNAIEKKGYGLGLAIAKRITDIHKGILTYSKTNESVNQFNVQLPHSSQSHQKI